MLFMFIVTCCFCLLLLGGLGWLLVGCYSLCLGLFACDLFGCLF